MKELEKHTKRISEELTKIRQLMERQERREKDEREEVTRNQ